MSRRLARLFLFLLTLLAAAPAPLLGCAAPSADDDSSATSDMLEMVDRSPPRESVEFAMDHYLRDPAAARAREPMSMDEFFGNGRAASMNMDKLRVELLKPNPRLSSQPVAFLHAKFYDTDAYWNNRYKDVQLFRLADATGTAHNPFPEAVHVPSEGAALVRIWTDFKPIKNGPPPGLADEVLRPELARIAIWSYVSGNVDGPAANGANGGFAHFRDASGRQFWRGVLIDAGASWNSPEPSHQPWNTNLLGKGPVTRDHIPQDVIDSMTQIARASLQELAHKSRFERIDEGALTVVRDIQRRAREVLDHYSLKFVENGLEIDRAGRVHELRRQFFAIDGYVQKPELEGLKLSVVRAWQTARPGAGAGDREVRSLARARHPLPAVIMAA